MDGKKLLFGLCVLLVGLGAGNGVMAQDPDHPQRLHHVLLVRAGQTIQPSIGYRQEWILVSGWGVGAEAGLFLPAISGGVHEHQMWGYRLGGGPVVLSRGTPDRTLGISLAFQAEWVHIWASTPGELWYDRLDGLYEQKMAANRITTTGILAGGMASLYWRILPDSFWIRGGLTVMQRWSTFSQTGLPDDVDKVPTSAHRRQLFGPDWTTSAGLLTGIDIGFVLIFQ